MSIVIRYLRGSKVCFRKYERCYSSAIQHKAQFEAIVGAANVVAEDIERFTTDWTKSYKGGSLVCLPKTTQEVSKVVAFCHKHDIAIVPQGGNTGLVGGGVGVSDGNELILSMARMNQVVSIDPESAVLICEAGCILEVLNGETESMGFSIPLDLGAKGSCMIGGNIATNAGGLRLLKYGSFHKNVLGLEVVLPDGTVLDMIRSLHKDNCGYALKNIFIGSEGTLGIITKLSLSLMTKPLSSHVILAKVSSFSVVAELLKIARRRLGSNLSAFEFMDANSVRAVRRNNPTVLERIQSSILPTSDNSSGSSSNMGLVGEVGVLIESTGSDVELDELRLNRFVEQIIGEEMVLDAVLSQDTTQERVLWQLRENIPLSLMQLSRLKDSRLAGKLYKFDVSIALSETDWFIRELQRSLIDEGYTVKHVCEESNRGKYYFCELEFCNFGHAGDQNLHLNLLSTTKLISDAGNSDGIREGDLKEFIEKTQKTISKHVYRLVVEKKGSISAEHGIGQQKRDAMLLARSSEEIQLMRSIKTMMDPKNIMNPFKVVP